MTKIVAKQIISFRFTNHHQHCQSSTTCIIFMPCTKKSVNGFANTMGIYRFKIYSINGVDFQFCSILQKREMYKGKQANTEISIALWQQYPDSYILEW